MSYGFGGDTTRERHRETETETETETKTEVVEGIDDVSGAREDGEGKISVMWADMVIR